LKGSEVKRSKKIRAAILTISDSSSKGMQADASGEVLKEFAASKPDVVKCAELELSLIKRNEY